MFQSMVSCCPSNCLLLCHHHHYHHHLSLSLSLCICLSVCLSVSLCLSLSLSLLQQWEDSGEGKLVWPGPPNVIVGVVDAQHFSWPINVIKSPCSVYRSVGAILLHKSIYVRQGTQKEDYYTISMSQIVIEKITNKSIRYLNRLPTTNQTNERSVNRPTDRTIQPNIKQTNLTD